MQFIVIIEEIFENTIFHPGKKLLFFPSGYMIHAINEFAHTELQSIVAEIHVTLLVEESCIVVFKWFNNQLKLPASVLQLL